MAKFRQGNLVLGATETITQGGVTRISASGAAAFNSLALATGETVTGISGDSTSSDTTQLLTASAIQTLVGGGSGVAGTSGTSGVAGTSGTSGTSSVTAAGTDTAVARYDGSTTIQDSAVFIDNFGNMTGVNDFTSVGDVGLSVDTTSSIYFDLGTITPGTKATLGPDVDNTISLDVGSSTYQWENLDIYAGTSLSVYVADSTSAAIGIDSSQITTFKELPLTPSEAPTTDYQVANKKYVDDTALAQVNAAIATGVNETVAIYNGTSSIQDSLVSIDSTSGNMSGVNDFSVDGNIYQVDNAFHYLGTDNDLTLQHTGAYCEIVNNTGELNIVGAAGSPIKFKLSADLAVTIASDRVVTFVKLPVTPSEAPTTDYQVANKKYVDDAASGLWDSTPDVNQTGSGITTTMTVDSTSTVFATALYIGANGDLEYADGSDSTSTPCIALALETGGGEKEVLLGGFIRNDAWNWTDIGEPVYLSTTPGGLTQTAPSGSGEQVQIVGIAKSADIVYFKPDLVVVEIA